MYTNRHPPHLTGQPLCQFNPPDSTGGCYADDRATESIEGFLNDGKKHLSYIVESCIRTNRTFEWFVTINYEVILSIQQIKKEWLTFTKGTSRHHKDDLAYFWVREITPSDPRRLHYHLGILQGFCEDEETVEGILRKCLRGFSQYHMKVERPRDPYDLAPYMLKLKDHQRDKILLFKPNLGLERVGQNRLFSPPGIKKTKLLAGLKEKNNRVKEGSTLMGHPELAQYISTFLGLPYKEISRMIGEDPYNEVWERWQDGMWSRRQDKPEQVGSPAIPD
jgi:hypothetical protein